MKQKTINDYQKAIIEKFNKDIEEGKVKYLTKTSPALIRNACIKCLKEENISLHDKKILFSFFELKKDEDLIKTIRHYPTGQLKSIGEFIKKGTSPKKMYIDELVAWLVDFQPRPFSNYRTQELNWDDDYLQKQEINDVAKTNFKKNDTIVAPKHKPNRFFKIIAVLIILILIPLSFLVYSIAKNTHFISKDVEHIRKISTNELTNYVETNHPVWQGVSLNGNNEYFTASGYHPETGKKLKLVSDVEKMEIVKQVSLPKPTNLDNTEKNKPNSYYGLENTQQINKKVFDHKLIKFQGNILSVENNHPINNAKIQIQIAGKFYKTESNTDGTFEFELNAKPETDFKIRIQTKDTLYTNNLKLYKNDSYTIHL